MKTFKQFNEVAPPGFGHTKSDKDKGVKKGGTAAAFDRARKRGDFKGSKSDMFAIMWSQKNKGDKPHYKPGTDEKYKKYQEDWKPEIEVIDTKKRKKEAEKKRKEAEASLPPHLKLDVMKKAFSEEPERTPEYKAMQRKLYPRGESEKVEWRNPKNRGRKRKVMAEFEPELEMVEDTGSEQRAAIKDAILQRKEALKKKMKARLNKEDWKPEIEHSKLGDAVKKKREKKRKEAESSLPPHLRLDVMKKAFAHTNEEVVKEEGAPTMSTGSTATAAGFSDQSDENGPTAGLSAPLGGLKGKPRGRGPKLKKQKYKCRTDEIGNKICTTEAHLMGDSKKVKIMSGVHDTRYWPHIVELDGTPGTDFVFYGRSPADVKLRLRKIYRPEQHKNMKVKRISPGEAIKYHWNKKLEAS